MGCGTMAKAMQHHTDRLKTRGYRTLRLVLVADTHLGFDWTARPRVRRRRRGEEFFNAFNQVIAYAKRMPADALVHGGDLFFRSKVTDALVHKVYTTLCGLADTGIPIYVVPGNHERAKLPTSLLLAHRNIHVFHTPRTYTLQARGLRLNLTGFPYTRDIRVRFSPIVAASGHDRPADAKVLCMHQSVWGASAGCPAYTFRHGPDVIRQQDIPPYFDLVVSGHMHKAQVLDRRTAPGRLTVPVVYPGATCPTSMAERLEQKGFYTCTITVRPDQPNRIALCFVPLPSRPMVVIRLDLDRVQDAQAALRAKLAALDRHAIVRVRVLKHNRVVLPPFGVQAARKLAPDTMTLSLAYPRPSDKLHPRTAQPAQ